MENNRKDRIWEEDIPMRKLTVDDAVLFNLKKIYFRQVEELCAPVLKKAGYSVGKIGFRNVNVLANCPFVQELRFYDCVGGVLSLFVFKASRGGEDFLAAYAPYSSKIYLLKDSGDRLPEGAEFVDCGASEGIVRLNVKYSFQENGSDVYKYVYLYFRTARIEKRFFCGGRFCVSSVILQFEKPSAVSIRTSWKLLRTVFCFPNVIGTATCLV